LIDGFVSQREDEQTTRIARSRVTATDAARRGAARMALARAVRCVARGGEVARVVDVAQ